MKIFTRVLTGICLVAGLQVAHAVPVTWGSNGHEYDVILSEGATWTGANASANALGSGWHLATLTSAAENAFVVGLISNSQSRSHFWLGGTDAAVEGTWAWVTGEAWSYTNWGAGEPNNSGNEDYLALDLNGSVYIWNDAPNNLQENGYNFARGYVIERNGTRNVPEPAVLSLFGLALLGLGVARRKGVKA